MPNYNKAELEIGAQNVYNHIIAVYGLKNAFSITRRTRELLKAEKTRRGKLPRSERCLDDFDKKSKTTKTKKFKKAKKKSMGLFTSLCNLFDKKGINKVTYSDAKACAKEAKPDSNLSEGHFRWYKKKYKKDKK